MNGQCASNRGVKCFALSSCSARPAGYVQPRQVRNIRSPGHRHPGLTRRLRLRRHVIRLRELPSAVPVVVPRLARSVVLSAAMRARAPRSGRQSAGSLLPLAEAPPVVLAHVTDQKESGMKLTSVAVVIFCGASFGGHGCCGVSATADPEQIRHLK